MITIGWALTFPNVGWISTVKVLAEIFHLEGFFVWHLVMATFIVGTWIILAFLTAMAFWKGKIFLANPEDVIKDSIKELRESEKKSTTPNLSPV